MMRITPIETATATTLKLEGNLSGPWVDELQRYWTTLIKENAPVELDLGAVSFLDSNGTTLLLRMEREGARLTGCSAFIRGLLHSGAPRQTTDHHKSFKKES